MSPERAWKRAEREIAQRIGGERVPITGRARGSAPDIAHNLFAVECKQRRRLPEWIRDAMSQARASARRDQLPIAVLHESGRPYSSALVVLELADFVDYFGEIPRAP
jgi:hypothetical protein